LSEKLLIFVYTLTKVTLLTAGNVTESKEPVPVLEPSNFKIFGTGIFILKKREPDSNHDLYNHLSAYN